MTSTAAARHKPPVCDGCPKQGKGFLWTIGHKDAKLLFLLETTNDDFLDGLPVSGKLGLKFQQWLTKAGINETSCAFANITFCYGGDAGYCRTAHVEPWLRGHTEKRVIVPVGLMATQALLGRTQSGMFGVVQGGSLASSADDPPIVVLPILSPAEVMKGRWSEEPAQIEYLKHARDLAKLEDPRSGIRSFGEPPEGIAGYCATPTLCDLQSWRGNLLLSEPVAVDIETAGEHIRLVGLYSHRAGYLAFPIRVAGGGAYWDTDTFPRAVEWLWDFLSDPGVGKVFHNGAAFDIPMLERSGFEVNGYVFDTMLAMHVAYPGVPKGLLDLAKVHLRSGNWKAMVKDETLGEGK